MKFVKYESLKKYALYCNLNKDLNKCTIVRIPRLLQTLINHTGEHSKSQQEIPPELMYLGVTS